MLSDFAREWRHLAGRQCRIMLWPLLKLLRRQVTFQTRHGRLTVSTADDGIGTRLWRDGQYEYGLSVSCLRFLREQCFASASPLRLYDIGANIGLIGIGLKREGLVDFVIAVEPDPENFTLLRRNVRSNRLQDCFLPLNFALSNVVGDLEFERSPTQSGDHRVRMGKALTAARQNETARKTIRVRGTTLDKLIVSREHVVPEGGSAVVWIDVQGHEGHVFQGGRQFLRDKCVPAISEIWPYGILRSGVSLEAFASIVASIWPYYWVERRRGHFVRYCTVTFPKYLEELGKDGAFGTAIFTHSPSA